MVSKNNQYWKQQRDAQRVPHYGLRKLSVGVASVLLSTTLYMGVTAHADTVTTPSESATPSTAVTTDSNLPSTETVSGNSASNVGDEKSNQTNGANENQAIPANANSNGKTEAQPVVVKPVETETPEKAVVAANAKAMETNDLASNRSMAQSSSAKPTEQPADTNNNSVTTLNTTFSWTIHYNDENGKALLPDSVITHDYTRTDTGNQMGNWSYVPNSVKVTGTPNAGYNIDNPSFKFDQNAGGTVFDYSTWQATAASIDGYTPNYPSVAITDQLPKNSESLHATTTVDSGKHEFTFVYTQQPKTVKINYVNDDDNETVVKTDSVSGKLNTAVTITPNLPSGYMLTPGKDVPNTYTVTDANNQAVTIHVQRQFVDVSDTDPQAKQTRTITLHYVYAGGSKDGQKAFDDAVLDVYYHRTATFDRTTNQTTYGDWMWDKSQGDTSTPGYHVVSGKWTNLPQSWATVTADVPSIKGYYADLGQNDPANTNHVPSNTWVFPTYNNSLGGGISEGGKGATAYLDGYGYEVGPTHTIKYAPNKTTVTVNYVDDDNNKVNVGSQHWDGTTGQHINLTLTPPSNYVLSPGWANPSSYDFDGVNSSWFTVHVKHATQDVTDQQSKDQVTKVTQLTRNHLFGDGPHKGEKFGEPDIFDLAWKRTATKDLVTNKVTFGDWQVDRDNSKNVQGSLHLYDNDSVGGSLRAGYNGYSYLGQNTHQEFSLTDGSTMPNATYNFGWYPDQALKYPILNTYYGRDQVNIPIYYVDADTGQKVAEKINGDALTGNDFRDGNTVTIDQSKLTSLPTTLTDYQLLPGQTWPTSYKIDTVAGVKGIKVQVVKDRSVKITFVDDDNKEAVIGTPTTITGHTGGEPVALNLTVPGKYKLAKGQQLPTTYTFTKGSGDVTIHLVHQAVERSVTVKFVDDEERSRVPGKEAQVGQAITLTGRDGDTVDLNLTVPDKYKLADSQQLPTTYAFTKGSGDVTIHLVHQVVQRNASIDVQLKLVTNVGNVFVTTQKQWTQLKDKIKLTPSSTTDAYNMMKSVEVGTLTGHVNYDLVDEEVVSFGDDWTSLKLSGQTYQLPNGTDVVNGVMVEGATYGLWGKKYKELYLEYFESQPDKYSDYINLPWHGYLSVNATNNPKNDEAAKIIGLGLQAGLVGDEPNAPAKVNGDHAATGVEIINKTVDLSLLKDANLQLSDSIYYGKAFSEQDGRLQIKAALPVVGVYVPYVEKTVTRTIKVTTPDGKTTTVKQNATLAKQFPSREDIHPDWTTGEWESYDVPTIPGYTASQTQVEAVAVNGDTTDQTVNISYTASKQSVNVNYVDVNEGNKVVHVTTVNGVTDGDATVANELPDGYKLVDGQSVPKTIHFNANNNNDINVKVQHATVTVTSDSPKTPSDKLPDNPSKSYPNGVSKDDLSKTVTRKVTITTPDGKQTVTNQTVTFTRNATVDEVTGNVTYGSWSENGQHTFTTVDVPTVPGYTATSDVPSLAVTPDSKDTNVTISYTANDQTTQVVFVDDDDNGKTVDYQDIHGKTGETQKLTDLPENYELANGQSDTITFSPNMPAETTVHLKHKIETKQLKINVSFALERLIKYGYDTPQNGSEYLWWISDDELNSGEYSEPYKNIGSVTGSVQYDLVSGEVVKVNNGETFKFDDTILSNYPLDIDVANSGSLTGGSDLINHKFADVLNEDTHSNLNYKSYASVDLTKDLLANEESLNHLFIRKNNLLPVTLENGKQHGSDYAINTVKTDSPFLINFNDLFKDNYPDHYDIEKNDDGSLNETAILTLPIVYQAYTSKTVTRTINVTSPDKTVKTIKQTAEINQNVGYDYHYLTGTLYKGDAYATNNNWSAYEVPTINGYTANKYQIDAVAVDGNTTDQTINISYTANKQSVNVNYVDINDGNKAVHTTTINGVTDGDSTVPNELPAGYKLVDGQSVPKTVHFNANNNNDINVKVQHSTVIVTPNSPKTPSDKLPDNPNKNYPSGVSENDLNKIITRTIKVTTPDGQTKTVAQTVKLTRTATVDEVTGEVTYGKWSTGQWGAYNVPAVPGYTASQPSVEITPVNENMKDQTVDVSYTPNKQSTTIKYVDDKGEIVHTTTVNGATDQTVKVSSEVPAGWTITKGQVPSEITFGADGHKPIEVTVAHQHVTVNPDHPQNNGTKLPDNPVKTFNDVEANDLNKTITRTIKVTTPDGQTKTVEQTVHLTRTADVDEVTGEVTYGNWTTGEWSNYDVPTVQGYTASQNEVPTAKVTGDTKDQTVTVTYTADQQKLIVNFIDDTTGQTLKTVNKDGLTNSDSNYNTKSDIQNYVNNHYRLVSDDTNGQNLVFDNDDSKTQTYNVHLAHNTHDINDSNTVTETIHYKLDNGQKAFDDYNAQLSFTRTGYNDEVTGQNHWNDWQATNGQTFNAVQSPSKEGYTPDKTSIEAINVKPGDKNIDTTVTYNANAQAAKISYIDDTTGRILKIDNANGKFNQAINFDNNVDNQIKDYEQQGYVLKSNSFSNQTYQADNAKNAFEVHFIHGTKNVQRTQKITETVQYQMEDGTKAPATNTQSVDFTQNGVQDLVTNNIDWKVTAPQQFKEVITPVMTGYTPDIASVPVTTVNFGDKNINKTVTYTANAQTAKISYIDDNTGATLKTDNANGKFNQAISFGDVDGVIKGFEDKGYQLKSNSFKGQSYQADNNSNVFEVHLVHGTKNVQRTQKITETINYQMDDGSKAPAANTQSVDFTQDGVQDLVTNNIDWKATAPQQFKAVDTPTVTGYTPSITNVPAITVNFGDKDINKTVTYNANAQAAKISYIDDNTGVTLKTGNTNGKFNKPISFDNNVDNQIKAFENQGYILKSNSFNGQKYQADNDKNVFEVHLVHGTKNVQRTQKITETVNYQMDDGSKAPVTTSQSVDFTQDGVQDLVTNNIDWKATEPQQFKAVDMPTLTGYTPDITSVPATTVNFGDKDINKTVTYKANSQSAKITYIDDNTGKTLKVDNANGKFNQVIDFANMNSDLQNFENQGYVLKSNSFNGQKYQADNATNTFEVHFAHGTKNVQRQDTITEIVKYQYDNGTPAHENSVQTLNFTQDGVQDLVTKNIDWNPTNAQEFKQVDTPAIDGYTPDITSISATKVNFGDSDINKVVTYQANNQTANIHYVDDMTGSFIGNDTANGKFGTAIDFGNVNDKINAFKNLGYQLVSNGFNGQTYQADNSKNVYYVHFTHGMKNVQRNKQITETIKYQYENGQQAQPDSVQTVSFNENGSQDLVTKKINWSNDTPQQFKAVSTPSITGYTADIDNIPAVVVNYDSDNINKVVTYKANSQTAKINYIDDTTGKVIKTDTANGKFNQAISFSETPTNVINGLIKRGYKLVSNSFNGQTYQNDNIKNEFTVHLAHNTKNVSKQNTVTRTINYLDNNGKAIQAPIIETVTFTQNGTTDLVTGNTTWDTPSSQTFEAVVSPAIKGFGKPDVEVVKPQTVNFNDQNVVVNVHYSKATTPTNVNNNTGQKTNDNTTTPTVDHNEGKLNPTTFTTTTHQTTPQAHTANNGGQQSITPQSVNKPSEQQTVANNGTKANTLPQTGNSNDNGTAIIGLGLLSGMLGLLGIKGKKKQD